MSAQLRRQHGDELYQALCEGRTLAPLTERWPQISIEDAYHVSLHSIERRVAAGDRIVGKKIGVTSAAVQRMLDVHQPDFGFITQAMAFDDGACISLAEQRLIQPRAEGEIAFVLKHDLAGPGVTEADVLAATDYVTPCFEIVDSRIHDWRIRIQDTVADNASCGVFVLGKDKVDPRQLDLPALRMRVWKNAQPLSEGLGAAVQGNPLTAVAWLANTLGAFGIPFKAGEVILSGSLVPLEPVRAGDRFSLTIDGLGSAQVSFRA
ncbi:MULTISPECIES: fumarylacetoacetate hydrolase family protein [unclassified Pseudomonas]|uniref:fumarylacetoacetate hydrolase family protein n=1 Tax=unclassified Pseudomonas TaxID=196821 RepID=UPI00244B80DC|nr:MULTISPECIES: fumarylacetoacetate hydrolase family protein [unclassified Pseudomonas]MDH0301680.1 fumarylacetoacetate hydrolase family protein [Pseudomonas sp. GD04091]MDH1984899.1 fumarylacetoacetate hydrolase family protein [Pseudomonas sp. GD03689]